MADTTPTLDARIFERNLRAWRLSHPHLAEAIDAALPRLPEVTLAPTRDGRLNFLLPQPDGRPTWFGRTSIPHVRAAALVERFELGNTNVLLPGVGEGTEIGLLLQRLGRHRALFVWETDPANLLLAFQLHDLAEPLRDGRLVTILSDAANLTQAIVETFERLPGHFLPDRVMVWPWQTPPEITSLQRAVEAACRTIEERRAARLTDLQNRLVALPPTPPAGRPPVIALLSIRPDDEMQAWTDGMISAADEVGWATATALVRGPADLHPVARAARLATGLKHAPDFALLLDVCRGDVADVLPAAVPAVHWLSHATPVDDTLPTRIGPSDRFVAVDSVVADRLVSAGVDPARISVRPQPCLVTCDEPPGWDERPIDVAIVADLFATDSQSHGFDLPSHIAIWNAVLELIRPNLDGFTDGDIEAMLVQTERRGRMRIEDAFVRKQLLATLAGPVAGTLILRALAQALVESGLTVACYGTGWADVAGLTATGPLPRFADRVPLYQQAKCALFASATGIVTADVLAAAAAGAAILWRAHPRDSRPGGFATILDPRQEATRFDRNKSVVSLCRRLLASADEWRTIVTAARHRCQSEHVPEVALAKFCRFTRGFLPSAGA
ncbi:MAG TPA: glycosyltransferase [Phycisphaerae bacterium]|nr:glycosyltransferase [Phycisphaerae bacterium]HOJ76112.1 glycosyltransferase [Phycisphaerae bacterium]HOM51846.1 glycosyltransferase [Phycisphaerae bacterium]HPP28623.1 glycosyltransferase [Phycisphaerae bacterium]HPU27305.1 glycosyltransferase [Phycisphaerae bacterium]